MYILRRTPMSTLTYQSALDKLGNRTKVKLGGNTYLEKREDDAVAVRLYHTDIITWQKNGHIILDSGRYQTVTTADRLQSFLGYNIIQRSSISGTWYLSDCTKKFYKWSDPIELDCHGKIIGKKTLLQETLPEIKAFRITDEKKVLKWTNVMHLWNRGLNLKSNAYGIRQLFKIRDNAKIDAHIKTLSRLKRSITARIIEVIKAMTLEQVSDLYDRCYDWDLKELIIKYCTGSFIPMIAMTEKKAKLVCVINKRITCYTKAA
jgi:hypothetical protein